VRTVATDIPFSTLLTMGLKASRLLWMGALVALVTLAALAVSSARETGLHERHAGVRY
jgi:hypothetical protein